MAKLNMNNIEKFIFSLSLFTSCILFLALFNMPYDYYILLRWCVFGICIFYSINYFELKYNPRLNIFVLGAILFNPIRPFYYPRIIWHILDILVGITFLLLVIEDIIVLVKKDNYYSYSIGNNILYVIYVLICLFLFFIITL